MRLSRTRIGYVAGHRQELAIIADRARAGTGIARDRRQLKKSPTSTTCNPPNASWLERISRHTASTMESVSAKHRYLVDDEYLRVPYPPHDAFGAGDAVQVVVRKVAQYADAAPCVDGHAAHVRRRIPVDAVIAGSMPRSRSHSIYASRYASYRCPLAGQKHVRARLGMERASPCVILSSYQARA